jgi:hypothetical protein
MSQHQSLASSVWSPAVARAVALSSPMPGTQTAPRAYDHNYMGRNVMLLARGYSTPLGYWRQRHRYHPGPQIALRTLACLSMSPRTG